jgi:ATP-binding cassette subfamily B protein AbcA/BmrA
MTEKLMHIDGRVVIASIATVVSSLVGVAIPLVLKKAIDQQSGFGNGVGFQLITLFVGQAFLITLGEYIMAQSGERQVLNIRQRLTGHLLYTPKDFLDHQQSGDLSSHVMNDTNSIRTFLTANVANFVAGIVTIIGSLIALFMLDWRLSLVLIACLPVVIVVVVPLSNLSEKYAEHLQNDTGTTTGFLTETFRETGLIKASTAEQTMTAKAGRRFTDLYRVALKADLLEAIASPLVLLCLFGAVAVIFTYGGQRVTAGTLTVGTLMSFLIYLFQLLNPLGGLSNFFAELAKMKGATARIQQLLHTPQEDLTTSHSPVPGDLVLANVTFGYGDATVLDDVTVTVPQNKKVAIVGPSGGGKSTLVSLIERFYPLTQGSLTLGGAAAQTMDLREWRQNFALVDQRNDIVAGTIRDNLLFGLQGQYTPADITRALADAGLAKNIAEFPDGLETAVGEDGTLLSGGQKQRLQIARAYLKSPRFIIFDEATANLDADAEHQVTTSLNKLLHQRTAIIIAHRLSTIVDADIIYFLEDHHITGQGTHAELMASHDSYRRFVQEQMIQ